MMFSHQAHGAGNVWGMRENKKGGMLRVLSNFQSKGLKVILIRISCSQR